MTESETLGKLIVDCKMPPASGMEVFEARLVKTQEVPPESKLQYYAVRGGIREPLTARAANELLYKYIKLPPVYELDQDELRMELILRRSEVSRMRTVYFAAKKWRDEKRAIADRTADFNARLARGEASIIEFQSGPDPDDAFAQIVDEAIAADEKIHA